MPQYCVTIALSLAPLTLDILTHYIISDYVFIICIYLILIAACRAKVYIVMDLAVVLVMCLSVIIMAYGTKVHIDQPCNSNPKEGSM